MSGAPKNVMGEIIVICKKSRLYYVPVNDKGRRVYVIYRKRPENDPRTDGIRAGKCRGGERALLNHLRRIAGIAPLPAKPAEPETAF